MTIEIRPDGKTIERTIEPMEDYNDLVGKTISGISYCSRKYEGKDIFQLDSLEFTDGSFLFLDVVAEDEEGIKATLIAGLEPTAQAIYEQVFENEERENAQQVDSLQ